MFKFFLFLCVFFTKITFVNAEIVKSILVNGNERIAEETIIIFSKINIGDDLTISAFTKVNFVRKKQKNIKYLIIIFNI